MTDREFDLVIIGGGINGVGIARDASLRGLKVLLVEKNDLASGTSSASTKLIHGGLRYLEQYEFKLVRKALKERDVLLQNAPHLIRPLAFVLPHQPHLRPSWLIRLGLFLYDHLYLDSSLPSSKQINLNTPPYRDILKPSLTKGFTYSDCWVDDARLVIANAIATRQNKGEILTRHKVVKAHRQNNHWQVSIQDQNTGSQSVVKAKVLVNAAGPWLNELSGSIDSNAKTQKSITLVRGSHIVVKKFFAGEHAYILQHSDQRIIFAIPYGHEFCLIGTTDVKHNASPDEVYTSQDEKDYLIKLINEYFNHQIKPADIIWDYSGVRPLVNDNEENLSEVTRDYEVHLDDNPAPLVTIYGGKLTTYRQLAEEAVDSLKKTFPSLARCATHSTPLPGGDLGELSIQTFTQKAETAYPFLPKPVLARYAESYGNLLHQFLTDAKSLADMGEEILPGCYAREVRYLKSHEWAQTADDVLWRRTKLGLYADKHAHEEITRILQEN